jgi:CheY-like chemotaxis protein
MASEAAPVRRVLVVDDSSTCRSLLRQLFEANGWEVRLAASGGEGLTLALNERFDLIVLDYLMPKLDGHDVCVHLHREMGNRLPPILIVTGHTNEGALAPVLSSSRVAGLVRKPLHGNELLNAAASCLTHPSKKLQAHV